jgi:GT2 family glycosyltransferase
MGQLQAQVAQLQAEQERLHQQLAEKEGLIAALYASRSWRITAPLRATKQVLLTILRWCWRESKRLPLKVGRAIYRALPIPYRRKLILKNAIYAFFRGQPSRSNYRAIQELVARRQDSEIFLPQKLVFVKRDLPVIDVSVLTYNSSKWIEGFFRSLAGQTYPPRLLNIIVTDHNSTDDTVYLLREMAKKYNSIFGGFEIFERPNYGFGVGHNFNISKGRAPYVLVTNIDVEFEPDAIENIIATAEGDDPLVASWEFRQKPYEHPKYYDPVTLETIWSSHACVLFRRNAFERVGGYEKKIFMYGEDVELSYRLRDHGYRLKYCPKAVVWHFVEVGQCKPLQFEHSLLANAYIRLRYGSIVDIICILPMYLRLFFMPAQIPRQRWILLKNIAKIIINSPYFLATRKKSNAAFPICEWDYGMRRDGAFYRYRREKWKTVPLVSVITRTYKGRLAWLRNSVASVLNQTYPNLELVVVEDGSDTAQAFIEEVARAVGPTIKIIYKSIPKSGRSRAGNVGLSLANGEFLCFLDDDDLLFADHIEVLVSELLAHPEAPAAYALSWEVETKVMSRDPLKYEEVCHRTPKEFRRPFSRAILLHHNFIPIQAVVFRRELYDRYGGFDESLDYLEDWNLWTRYSQAGDFLLIEKTTSMFRVPFDPAEKATRQMMLDKYYPIALQRQPAEGSRSHFKNA